MFSIKICGITSAQDARAAADSGADAVGLNFYQPSPRCVDPQIAQSITAALPSGVAKVGVFVNAEAEFVQETSQRLGLDWIQLHGDEPPEYLAPLDAWPVIKVFRLQGKQLQPLHDYLRRCRETGRLPEAVMVDAAAADMYGGTGRPVDWSILDGHREWLAGLPLVLAGGLTPHNIASAIQAVRPAAVDTASGVESAPGVKDRNRVEQFIQRASQALADIR